jgi:hypothetical protein
MGATGVAGSMGGFAAKAATAPLGSARIRAGTAVSQCPRRTSEDQFQHARDGQQADDKDDRNDPQKNFHFLPHVNIDKL